MTDDPLRAAIRKATTETECNACGGAALVRAVDHIATAVQPLLDAERERYEALRDEVRLIWELDEDDSYPNDARMWTKGDGGVWIRASERPFHAAALREQADE